MKNTLRSLSLLLISFAVFSCSSNKKIGETILNQGWTIAPTAEISANGETLSSNAIDAEKWTKTTVPNTVMGALVDAGKYPDIFMGDNLAKVPSKQFESSWWFRNSFNLEDFDNKTEHLRLLIDGINYRANFWLNGKEIAHKDSLFGAFRQFELDISGQAKSGENILLVEIFPPQVRDFYMGFVDWAPTPPDHYMGIFREIRLKRSGKVSIDASFVAPDVNTSDLSKASVTISTEVSNHSDEIKNVALSGTIENISFKKVLTLQPHEKTEIKFSPEEFEQLNISNPRLWWPNGLGEANMYALEMQLVDNGVTQDVQNTKFGIRKIETYLNAKNVRGYKVNGREVLIKSGGWVDDLFLRYMPEKDAAQIRYVKEMNLNSLRFEGVWGNNQHIYDLCDENGILLMVGWSCQWEWPDYLGEVLEKSEGDENLPINEDVAKYGVKLSPDEETLLSDYFRDQVKWLRNHPSIFTWAGGSDAMPAPSLEKRYLQTLEQYDPTRPFLVSAGDFDSNITGKSGMKMNGPYEYVPPIYWYEDKELGGAYGFNSEVGPGPQIPPIDAIKKMIPADKLWPAENEIWNFHSGRKDFNTMGVYLKALYAKLGEPKDLEDLAFKAQIMNYEAIRPMFESHVMNRPTSTGVVQWMLNSPWPEFYWQLYDYYLMPTGAYYGTKKAAKPVSVMYNYFDQTIHLSNDTQLNLKNVTANVTLFDSNSKVVFEKTITADLATNSTLNALKIPELEGENQVYFLDLKLEKASGELIADNFYWLATKGDQMDWNQRYWFYTPQKEYADFSALNNLTKTEIEASKETSIIGDEYEVTLKLTNPSDDIAFFIEAELINADSQRAVTPVFWSDNYISILPNETKTITVKCYKKDTGDKEPKVKIKGYNLENIIVR
ncbi:glycosyl hydrolase 2 galactose-binding domain-containing protein [Arcticibacterium luteifluviistationis]|uniref:Glycoside hydrolase family 2 n=1 Tax=Arcticibacterium luteifluviistationis TaxID=1784714 RepID=A0A2Z4GBK7_9BACT|nr:glycoside hydrolase family 2 protein [Arcticibacterium luteifluviistationis]AWV98511.1 glycoside hydrolase family 2 [Arcticibacterium luteifluviistationis]